MDFTLCSHKSDARTGLGATMTIGVFDSGVGGLTVLAALREALPQADLLYLGDTARVPYGSRSQQTVARYASDCARWLLGGGCEQVVIACNTASAYGADLVREFAQDRPVFGVVRAGAAAAQRLGGHQGVAVLATRGTVTSQAYEHALADLLPGTPVRQVACPLLAPMIEEGWYDHPAIEAAIATYLSELDGFAYDRLILGCTHYPLIRERLQQAVGERVMVIDSSQAIAETIPSDSLAEGSGLTRLAFSDDPDLSMPVARRIFNHPIHSVTRMSWDTDLAE
jgi:glutamate racemase